MCTEHALEVHYPVPEFTTLAGGDWNPIACPRAAHVLLQSPSGKIITLRTAKLQHRDTC